MNLAERRKRGCEGKRRYATEVQARRYKDAFETLGLDVGLNVYLCRFCSWWHLGHKTHSHKRRAMKLRDRLNTC